MENFNDLIQSVGVIDFKNQNVRENFWLDTQKFIQMEAVPMQRFTEGRAKQKQVQKMLNNPTPEQLDVAIAELTEDSEYLGTKYKKGWQGILNGNTRAYFWKNNLSKLVPKDVYVTKYYFDSMEEVRRSYDTFDSMDATEKKHEKIYGVLVRSFNYTPQSTKIIKGQIVSALNIANYYYNPSRFNQPTLKVEDLPEQIVTFLEEIKTFDSICTSEKHWDQALIASALLTLKKYGTTNKRLLEGLQRINTGLRFINSNRMDGITHIIEEWKSNEKFPSKGTSWEKAGGLKETVSFAVYWINKWMENEELSQLGFNWADSAKSLFPQNTKKFKNVTKKINTLFEMNDA
jgi:hypothetical protein